jgi:hypothetical protein
MDGASVLNDFDYGFRLIVDSEGEEREKLENNRNAMAKT